MPQSSTNLFPFPHLHLNPLMFAIGQWIHFLIIMEKASLKIFDSILLFFGILLIQAEA